MNWEQRAKERERELAMMRRVLLRFGSTWRKISKDSPVEQAYADCAAQVEALAAPVKELHRLP